MKKRWRNWEHFKFKAYKCIWRFKVGEMFPWHILHVLQLVMTEDFSHDATSLSSFCLCFHLFHFPPSSSHLVIWQKQKIRVVCAFMSTCWQAQWLAWRYAQVSASVRARVHVCVDASYFVWFPRWNQQLGSVVQNNLDKWRLDPDSSLSPKHLTVTAIPPSNLTLHLCSLS